MVTWWRCQHNSCSNDLKNTLTSGCFCTKIFLLLTLKGKEIKSTLPCQNPSLPVFCQGRLQCLQEPSQTSHPWARPQNLYVSGMLTTWLLFRGSKITSYWTVTQIQHFKLKCYRANATPLLKCSHFLSFCFPLQASHCFYAFMQNFVELISWKYFHWHQMNSVATIVCSNSNIRFK